MTDESLGQGSKQPGRTAGAPHPPGHRQSDGPDHPGRDVPAVEPDEPHPLDDQPDDQPQEDDHGA